MNQQLDTIFSVTQITHGIKTLLEEQYRDVTIHGEISNFKRHSSGHLYFTLKDANAQISAVMFRGNTMNMFFTPRDGMEVLCRGNVSVYEPRGNYQILVRDMHPKGEGALRVAFEKLKQQLFEEGLFDEELKKPIPRFPEQIAIITSPTGAAIRDMLSVLRAKNPSVRVVTVPVQVQGADAAPQIAAALDMCNEYGNIDTIIVGRGGGSLEDLWAFNEEVVARAIYRSSIPVISGVGHEVDYTIADYVADLRAATPSVAADAVVMDRDQLLYYLQDISLTIDKFVRLNLEENREKVRAVVSERVFTNMFAKVHTYMQLLDHQSARLDRGARHSFERIQYRVNLLDSRMKAHDTQGILRKGYAMLRRDGEILDSVEKVQTGDTLSAELFDGTLDLNVDSVRKRNDKEKD